MRDRGFITLHPGMDYGQAYLLNAWSRDSDAGSLHLSTIYPRLGDDTHLCSYALGLTGALRRLIGGGFDLPAGVLAPDATQLAPRPAWLAANDQKPLVFVRGKRAYAIPSYVGDPGGQCQRQVEVLLPNGTSCGKLQISEPQDCDGGTPLVNPSGTILEPVPLDLYDGGTRTVAYRVWVHLLQSP